MSRCETHQITHYGICHECIHDSAMHLPSKSMAGYCPNCHSFSLNTCLCKAPPAQPPTADTSPSRIQNAASANDAASFLTIVGLEEMRDNFEAIIEGIADVGSSTIYFRDRQWLRNALRLVKQLRQQRIEVRGVEGHASANEVPSTQKPTLNRAGIYAEMEPRSNQQGDAESWISAAGINPGLTSSLTREQALQLLDRYAAASIDRWCTGELKPQVDAAAEACLEAFGIGTEKASSLDATESIVGRESRNTCGKIDAKDVGTAKQNGSAPPLRIAVDPWQGLGKTWSDK